MARRRPLEETLLALRRVRESPGTEEPRREFDGLPRADPGCAAKTAIVEALRRLEHDDRALMLYERAQVAIEDRPELADALARAFGRRS